MNAQIQSKAKSSAVPSVSFAPASTGLLQRAGASRCAACLGTKHDDEQAMGLALQRKPLGHHFGRIRFQDGVSMSLQPMLAISQPGDRYEQEADRVTEYIVRMPEPPLQRQAILEGEDEEELLQTRPLVQRQKELEGAGKKGALLRTGPFLPRQIHRGRATPVIVQQALRSPGRPLAPPTRTFMEQRFGHDFSNVRVHVDNQAAKSAQAVNALAYTTGSHIVFGADQYSTATDGGKRLVAHELAHVIQQGAARPLPTLDVPGTSAGNARLGRSAWEAVPVLHTGKDMQCVTDTTPLTIAGLGTIEEVADALLAQAPVEHDSVLAELVQARADFANTGTLQLPASAVLELSDLARSAAAELPSWIPAPQIPVPAPDSGDLVMAGLDPRIVAIVMVIAIIVILIILYLLGRQIYDTWKSAKHLYEQGSQPSEETDTQQPAEDSDTGEVPATGDTGVADLCALPGQAPKANECGKGSCAASPTFCTPCQSEEGAKQWRDDFSPTALEAIGGYVDASVIPVWKTYLYGGASGKKVYSDDYGQDVAESETTLRAADFLVGALEDTLKDDPPQTHSLSAGDVQERIGALYGENGDLEDPASVHTMNFNDPKSIPGNLAGGAGTEQTACAAGAKPSTQKDARRARMEASIRRVDADFVEVTSVITFTIRDTVDLCPGNCGEKLEWIATVPFSRYEATGISGDVPFEVTYQVFPDPFQLSLPEAEGVPAEPGALEGDTAVMPP